GPQGHEDGVDQQRAHSGLGARGGVDSLEIGVVAEAAAREVDVVELGHHLVDGGGQARGIGDEHHTPGTEGSEVLAILHHELPDVTRPEPLDDRTLYDGDCRVVDVVLVVERVVAVVARVVAAVVVLVVLLPVVAAAAVVVVDVPEKERAARAERAPVSTRPPAIAPRVRVEMRRKPASRRAMGSGLMTTDDRRRPSASALGLLGSGLEPRVSGHA